MKTRDSLPMFEVELRQRVVRTRIVKVRAASPEAAERRALAMARYAAAPDRDADEEEGEFEILFTNRARVFNVSKGRP